MTAFFVDGCDSSFFPAILGFQPTSDVVNSQNEEVILLAKQVIDEKEIAQDEQPQGEEYQDEMTLLLNLPIQSPRSNESPFGAFSFSSAAIQSNIDNTRKKKVATAAPTETPQRKRSADDNRLSSSSKAKSARSMKCGVGPPELLATFSDLSSYIGSDSSESFYCNTNQDDSEPDAFFGNQLEKRKTAKSSQTLTMRGENRLKINFIDYGRPGKVPQKFGKHGCGIPDGLCGSNRVYCQNWKFEITHTQDGGGAMTLISWKVTNLETGTVTQVTESPHEAMMRETQGRTISNMVVKQAFESHARELERSLPELAENPTRLSSNNNVQKMIVALRPKRCTIGLIFFGLLHEVVQARLNTWNTGYSTV